MRFLPLAAAVLAGVFCLAPARDSLRAPAVESNAVTELLALHQAARRAHFQRDVEAIVASTGPEFTFVRDGKVRVMSRDDVRRQFTEYFRGAEFSAWDDLEPPVIHVSPDGQMGWMIVRMKIAYSKADATGKKSHDEAVMSWMSVYEKRDGKWLHVANASTVEP